MQRVRYTTKLQTYQADDNLFPDYSLSLGSFLVSFHIGKEIEKPTKNLQDRNRQKYYEQKSQYGLLNMVEKVKNIKIWQRKKKTSKRKQEQKR